MEYFLMKGLRVECLVAMQLETGPHLWPEMSHMKPVICKAIFNCNSCEAMSLRSSILCSAIHALNKSMRKLVACVCFL